MSRALVSENLESILTAVEISTSERASLWDAFFSLNSLDFAKHLHRQEIPDKVKGDLLALRVRTPYCPADRDEILKEAMDDAMSSFWSRIGARQES